MARTIYAPLTCFNWEGDEIELAPGYAVKQLEEIPWPEHRDYFFSEHGRYVLEQASHWFCFEHKEGDVPSSTEVVHIFQVALWLVSETEAHIRYVIDGPNSVTSMNSTVSYVVGYKDDRVTTAQIEEAGRCFEKLLEVRKVQGRLHNALWMTFNASHAAGWASQIVNLGSALECLLTYSEGGGITRRLAKTFACLTEIGGADEKARRDGAFSRCADLYDVRSDIMHGRIQRHQTEALNRRNLFEWRRLVRTAWRAILVSDDALRELEHDDKARKAFFKPIETGYTPPGPSKKHKVSSRMRGGLASSKKARTPGTV